jgi:protein-tyrosine-phosphatase/DNA-binding transcriptional ArsR family regulator
MESAEATAILTALSHPGRLEVFRLLVRRAPEGVCRSEIAAALGLKANTLSVYLASLRRAGLLQVRRDGKSLFYSAAPARMGALLDYLAGDCCRARPDALPSWLTAFRQERSPKERGGRKRPLNVLFVCTGNSARSIFAEAILNEAEPQKFRAFSAGTKPYAKPNPRAIALLEREGYNIAGLYSKDLLSFQRPGAPKMDFVFTVCDQAANEYCPPWPARPLAAHWSMADPVQAGGSPAARRRAFRDAYGLLEERLSVFRKLPLASLDRLSLQEHLDAIGQMPAAPRAAHTTP